MKQDKEKKLINDFARSAVFDMITDLYSDGVLKDSDFEDEAVMWQKVDKHYKRNPYKFKITIGHREHLLKLAKQEYNTPNIDFAITLFAIYVEHTLNRIIHLACIKKKLDRKTTTEIIQKVQIHDKCTWILKLLGLPGLKSEYLKTIRQLSERRNAYIHYKWKPLEDGFDPAQSEKGKNQMFEEIKYLIKYLKRYESRVEFADKKNKIQSIAEKTPNMI